MLTEATSTRGAHSRVRLALAATALALVAPGARADRFHVGSADPVGEGWTATGDTSLGQGLVDSFFGLPYWQIDDQSSDPGSALFYDAGQFPQPLEPWTLSARVRCVLLADPVDQGIFMEVTNALHQRHLIWLGGQVDVPDPPGTTWVHLSNDGTTPAIEQNSFPIPGVWAPVRPAEYIEVELASDGVTADLFVNGVLVFGGYTGFAAPAVSPRVLFGAGSSVAQGLSNWSRVAYETGVQACNNGLDDDGNGLVDVLDPWCASPLDPREGPPPVPCSEVDFDGDGVCDWNEPEAGTSGADADSDDDGFDDGTEILAGTDPSDPLSFPPPVVPLLPPLAAVGLCLCLAAGARLARPRVS